MRKPHNILVAHDFSECSAQALAHGIELATKTGAALHFLYVEVLYSNQRLKEEAAKTKAQLLREKLKEAIMEAAEKLGIGEDDLPVTRYTVLRDIAAAPAIIQYCFDYQIDMAILGTHGRTGFTRKLLGSVAEEVVRQAPCTVLTVREQVAYQALEPNLNRIAVPIDFSDYSRAALRYALDLAKSFKARLDLVHVVEERLHPAFYNSGVFSIYDIEPEIESKLMAELRKLFSEIGDDRVQTDFTILSGSPAKEILHWMAPRNIDLLVIATHGLSGLERTVLGSVTERIVREAPCPVITIKPKDAMASTETKTSDTERIF